MAYVICGMMDQGFKDFQLEAAISKIYASVRFKICFVFFIFPFFNFLFSYYALQQICAFFMLDAVSSLVF